MTTTLYELVEVVADGKEWSTNIPNFKIKQHEDSPVIQLSEIIEPFDGVIYEEGGGVSVIGVIWRLPEDQ